MSRIIPPSCIELARVRAEVSRDIRQQYASQLENARWFARFLLWVERERAIEAEMRRRFPPHVLRVSA